MDRFMSAHLNNDKVFHLRPRAPTNEEYIKLSKALSEGQLKKSRRKAQIRIGALAVLCLSAGILIGHLL